MSKTRNATHAGSWYTNNARQLKTNLNEWLNDADNVHGPARAIIAPHAGYRYCGSCAGHAYRQIDPKKVRKVFILGPSHHVRLSTCALSPLEKYQTPFYDLKIDQEVYSELRSTNAFENMYISTDENEHSIEMQLPYIAQVMSSQQGNFTIVPVLVGSLTPEKESKYGKIFAPYLANPENLFVISSDFCHWGNRFRYDYYDKNCGEIWQSIENLDKQGMDIIENMDPSSFTEYLRTYGNTICGRHPIGVLLNAVNYIRQSNGHRFSLRFVNYAQSSRCKDFSDSSVSYASASLVIS